MSVPELPEDFDVFAIREHPIAALFPMLPPDRIRSLANSIEDNGLRRPVVICHVDNDWLLLDGRNRRAACRLAGVPCAVEVYANVAGHAAFVVDANLERRDLTDSQRAMIAAEIATRGRGRTSNAPIGAFEKPTVTLDESAKLLRVTRRNAQRARKVLVNGAPELVSAVKQGAVRSISAAVAVATLPKEEQRKAVAESRVAEVAKEVREAAAVADPVVVTKTSFRPAEDVEVWDEWAERDWLLDLRSTLRDARDEWVRQKGSVRGLLSNVRLWLSLMEKEDE